jgi:hypothetical protein
LFLFASCSIQNNQVNTETKNSDNQKISTEIKKQSVDVKEEVESGSLVNEEENNQKESEKPTNLEQGKYCILDLCLDNTK